MEAAAWKEFCRRIEALGDDVEDAEGLSHLVEQVVCWLGWSVLHADARLPAFHRQNDLVTRWGGPNADNVYRHARVDPRRRIRLRGTMHACEDFILAVRAGFMHMETWGTLTQVTASELASAPATTLSCCWAARRRGPLPSPTARRWCRFASTTPIGF